VSIVRDQVSIDGGDLSRSSRQDDVAGTRLEFA
jgi:hypothetical protein